MSESLKMTNEQKLLLGLLSNILFPGSPQNITAEALAGCRWRILLSECAHHSCAGHVCQALKQLGGKPEECSQALYDRLCLWQREQLARAVTVQHLHVGFGAILDAAGIPHVFMKGCASAKYYPEPMMRKMGDVDFLVPDEYFERAALLLEKNGCIRGSGMHPQELGFKDMRSGLIVELHRGINGTPEGEVGERINFYLSDIYEKSYEHKMELGSCRLPSDFHHGLIIAVHSAHHLAKSGLGLRHLCDWAVFACSMDDDEFEANFKVPLSEIGLWRFARIMTAASSRYLGCRLPSWAESVEEGLSDALMGDILKAGDLGSRERDRDFSGALVTSADYGSVGDVSMPCQMIRTANEVVKIRWPAARKIHLLYPVGWIYFGTRYLILVVCGRRQKLPMRKMIVDAYRRIGIYSGFGLFEPQKPGRYRRCTRNRN